MAKKSFEQYMLRLDEIVKNMENGEGTLDETLSWYEEGVKIAKICNKMLDDAQQKVTILSKNGAEVVETVFEGENEC